MISIKKLLWQSLLPTFLFCLFAQNSSSFAKTPYFSDTEQNYTEEISADGFYNWSPEKFPLKVHFDKNPKIPGFRSSFVDTLKTCFDDWSRVSDGKLSWVETKNPAEADIKVSWSAAAVEATRGTEAGKTRNYARYNPATNWGVIDDSQMRLLTRLPEREFSAAEIRKAYLHEVGHAFGIAGHSSDPGDIMYFSVSNQNQVDLSQKDIATMQFLYKDQIRNISSAGQGASSRSISTQINRDHSQRL